MSPTKQEKLQADADELEADLAEAKSDRDRLETDLQDTVATPRVSRDVVVSIEVTCRTDDPDVTDEQIAAAAQEQVTLPNTIWIDKPAGGQIPVSVITVALEPPEEPVVP
jgi:hypothetical protein